MRGHNIGIFANFPNRTWVELVKTFSSGANAVNEVSIFENSQVLSDCLPGEMSALGEPRDRMRLTAAQLRDD